MIVERKSLYFVHNPLVSSIINLLDTDARYDIHRGLFETPDRAIWQRYRKEEEQNGKEKVSMSFLWEIFCL